MLLKGTPESLFFSRNDPDDPRLGERAKSVQPNQISKDNYDFQILGYNDDSGIQLNGGRSGAKDAPNQIRTFLYNMTVDTNISSQFRIADLGNIEASASLETTHQDAQALADQAFSRTQEKGPVLSLGGGHDFAYADGSAFLKNAKNRSLKKPLIINFDAHLDVRPNLKGNHSGTPFRRLLEDFGGQFEFIEAAIQPQCNSRKHWQWAQNQGAVIFSLESFEKSSLADVLAEFLDVDPDRPLWISLDIDAFSSSEAPGCSQSWTSGIQFCDFLPALRFLVQNFSTHGIGIYEVSPPLDHDHRTSKLAALACYHYLFLSLQGKKS